MIDRFVKQIRRYRTHFGYRMVTVDNADDYLTACAALVSLRLGYEVTGKYDIRKFKPISGESET